MSQGDPPGFDAPDLRHFASLINLFHGLLSTLDLDEALSRIARSAAELLELPYVALWLREGEFLEMRAESSRWIEAQNQIRRLRVGEGVGGRAAEAREPLYIEDIRSDPRWVNAAWARQHNLGSCLSVPLMGRKDVVGVLSCVSRGVRHFSRQETYLATTFANSAAFAVENARAFADLERSYAELKERQQMLVRAEKLTTLGTLASGLAHEILNPANIIGLHGQRLQMGGSSEAEAAQSAEVILRNVKRIDDICQTFRQYSREEKLKAAPLDPDSLITDTLPLVQHEYRTAGIEIALDLGGGGLRVMGDRSSLQQVFVNLYTNARDAMSSGGRLRISTQAAETAGQPCWEARLQDTGPGIPPGIIGRIFDPFFTTKPQEKGTGLGLFITHGIVAQHGGALLAESPPGQGATFIIQLPLVKGAAAP